MVGGPLVIWILAGQIYEHRPGDGCFHHIRILAGQVAARPSGRGMLLLYTDTSAKFARHRKFSRRSHDITRWHLPISSMPRILASEYPYMTRGHPSANLADASVNLAEEFHEELFPRVQGILLISQSYPTRKLALKVIYNKLREGDRSI
ncbi:hypothetical protein FNV43_RR24648 [Rhamnella rubrinervis]|uniref:Uncharacterized protein n=1 Tax=Rhamnella rubrinervis TaxID=2594499 RepID=A0A8K0DRL0_9ROSA|nr:hypothetical protein FNV43_RR24648 [Rhamnella rubrinervis]